MDAVEALSRLKDPRATKGLLENLLGDPCGDVKLGVIDALSAMGDQQVVPWLKRLIKGRDEEIVWDEESFFHEDWDDWLDIQIKSIQGLARLDAKESVPDIVSAITDEDGQDLSESAFRALANLGPPGIEALEDFLTKPDLRLRRRVGAVLAGLAAPEAQAGTTRALKDEDKEVRMAAARALVGRDPADVRFQLLFTDPDAGLRAFAVQASGQWHSQALSSILDDRSPEVQLALLNLFEQHPSLLSGEVLAPWINARLASSDAALAGGAARNLAATNDPETMPRLTSILHGNQPGEARLGALKGLAGMAGGEATADDLIRALLPVFGDDDRQIRLEAMAVLAKLAADAGDWPNPAGDLLLALMQGSLIAPPQEMPEVAPQAEIQDEGEDSQDSQDADSEPEEPLSTLQSIAGEKPPEEGDGQMLPLSDQDQDFFDLSQEDRSSRRMAITTPVGAHKDARQFATRLAAELSAREVVEVLISVLRDDDPDIRTAAAESLARIARRDGFLPADAVASLVAVLPSLDRDSRLFAVRALGNGGGKETGEAVEDCLDDEDVYIRAEAVRALSLLGAGGSWMARMIEDPNADVRMAAAEALARGLDGQAVDRLVDFAFSFEGHHRREAGSLLRGLDVRGANERFVEILADPARERERLVAIEALEELNRVA